MSISNHYTDIVFKGSGQFAIIAEKKDDAFGALKRIERVLVQGLECADANQNVTNELLRQKAQSIHDGYLNKSRPLSRVTRFFWRVAQKEQKLQSAYNRIESLATPLSSQLSITIPQVETISKRGQFLTGKVKKQNLTTVSPELHKNMENAQRIQAFVEQKILHSQNYPQRSKLFRSWAKKTKNNPFFKTYEDQIQVLNKNIVAVRSSSSSFASIEKYKVGNCGEMAKVGLAFAKCNNIPAEWWKIEGGDHAFLVIGSTQSADYRYWDRAAVVCDPWSMGLYPATHIETYLKNFITVSKVNGIYKTKIEPFNPQRHTLKKVK